MRASLDALKEELSTSTATARNIAMDFIAGRTASLDESKLALSFAQHSGGDATKSLMLDQMWLSALGSASSTMLSLDSQGGH